MKKRTYYTLLAISGVILIAFCGLCALYSKKNDSLVQSEETAQVGDEPVSDNNLYVAPEDQVIIMSAPSGCYKEEFELSISCDGADTIYYTLDGSDPACSKTRIKYADPVKITDSKDRHNVVSAVLPDLISFDGSELDETVCRYVSGFDAPSDEAVDKCTVIRAAAFTNEEATASSQGVYFVGDMNDHIEGLSESTAASNEDLAVLSITMDYDDLFDPVKGIYVKGQIFENFWNDALNEGYLPESFYSYKWDANYNQHGRDWERKATAIMLNVSGDGSCSELFSQDCGIRIQGGISRSSLQKNFRLYARKDYGDKYFRGELFGNGLKDTNGQTVECFHTLNLRSGVSAGEEKFEDPFLQDMLNEQENGAVTRQKSRPCVVYLNGEYWGVYILQTDFTEHYLESVYGIDKDNIDLCEIKEDKVDENSEPGTTDSLVKNPELIDIYEFLDTHESLKKKEDYDEFCKLVDPESAVEYYAEEIWLNNQDWPDRNCSMWRAHTPDDTEYGDGRWRFLMYDLEASLDYPEKDFLKEGMGGHIKEDGGLLNTDSHYIIVKCFAYLMTNQEFRAAFKEKMLDLSNETFAPERTGEYMDRYIGTYMPLLSQHYDRYPSSGSAESAKDATDRMMWFLENRGVYIWPVQNTL